MDIAAIGNVEAFASISIRSQVTGQLQEILFHEGDFVKAGSEALRAGPPAVRGGAGADGSEPPRDKALLAQAEAQLTRDAANAEYQQLTSERQSQLVQRGIISKDQAEQARAQADATPRARQRRQGERREREGAARRAGRR